MGKVYEYYEIAVSEDSYRVRIDTVSQNNCCSIKGYESINPDNSIDL